MLDTPTITEQAAPRRPVATLLAWTPMPRGSLLGFAKVQFPSGLIVDGIGVHRAGKRAWASPPSRPWIKDGAVVVNEITGKPNYEPVIQFHDHGARRRWSEAVLKALRTAQPDAVPETSP